MDFPAPTVFAYVDSNDLQKVAGHCLCAEAPAFRFFGQALEKILDESYDDEFGSYDYVRLEGETLYRALEYGKLFGVSLHNNSNMVLKWEIQL